MLQIHKISHDSRFLFFKGLDLVRLNLGIYWDRALDLGLTINDKVQSTYEFVTFRSLPFKLEF